MVLAPLQQIGGHRGAPAQASGRCPGTEGVHSAGHHHPRHHHHHVMASFASAAARTNASWQWGREGAARGRTKGGGRPRAGWRNGRGNGADPGARAGRGRGGGVGLSAHHIA